MYRIYVEMIAGNGSTYREQYECKDYLRQSDGVLDFWNEKDHWFISIHKMNAIMIRTIDEKTKGDEIKCIT